VVVTVPVYYSEYRILDESNNEINPISAKFMSDYSIRYPISNLLHLYEFIDDGAAVIRKFVQSIYCRIP
jgi:hypothetical protein